MSGEHDLKVLLRSMEPVLHEPIYVFAPVPRTNVLPLELRPVMVFREAEGTTLILEREQAEAAGLAGTFPCRMITLNVHSALDAVGFLAAITARLAREGIGANAVSAFYHDHLFVPCDQAEDALRALHDLAAGGLPTSS